MFPDENGGSPTIEVYNSKGKANINNAPEKS